MEPLLCLRSTELLYSFEKFDLWMYQCTDVFTAHHLLQVAYSVHVEYDNRKLVFLAHASSGQVHHLEATAQYFVVSDVVEL